jgi:hypothetical protein
MSDTISPKGRVGKKMLTLKMTVPAMTMQQICVSVDEHKDDDDYLCYLVKLIGFNSHRFTQSEFDYMIEHIEQYCK